MAKGPKETEIKLVRALNALKNLAPGKKFGNKSDADFEVQVNKSLAPRQRLIEIDDEKIEQQALRDSEDGKSLKMLESMVAGVVSDDDFGPDSALYEAMGYVRKSERKSGLTRKKKEPSDPED